MVKSLYFLKNYQKFGGMSIKAMKLPVSREKREGKESHEGKGECLKGLFVC
jgi:hypothetical protein